jgi:hypothetical protein
MLEKPGRIVFPCEARRQRDVEFDARADYESLEERSGFHKLN